MKLFQIAKDGGPESHVSGLFAVEIKRLFSVVLLRFAPGSRDAYHSHAFSCFSWVLRGRLVENHMNGKVDTHDASWRPFITRRSTFHKVVSDGTTWVLSFRGPWANSWREYIPASGKHLTLTNGRVVR